MKRVTEMTPEEWTVHDAECKRQERACETLRVRVCAVAEIQYAKTGALPAGVAS